MRIPGVLFYIVRQLPFKELNIISWKEVYISTNMKLSQVLPRFMRKTIILILIMQFLCDICNAFYVPGVAPQDCPQGAPAGERRAYFFAPPWNPSGSRGLGPNICSIYVYPIQLRGGGEYAHHIARLVLVWVPSKNFHIPVVLARGYWTRMNNLVKSFILG